eukprot:g45911.t1
MNRSKARYWESKALDPDFHSERHGGRTYSTLPRPDQIALEWACYFMWRSALPTQRNIRTPPVLSIWMKAISKTGIAHVGSGVVGKVVRE